MTTRNAVDTLTGYFYQFDLSILCVLRLPDVDDSIQVECIEDVDIYSATESTAIQCKYYAKTEYNHSVIKDAIMSMLTHFKESKSAGRPAIKYVLYGHYSTGHDKLLSTIDVDFLKKHFLTYTLQKVERFHHLELGLSDFDLIEFLSHLRLDIRAPALDIQFSEVIDSLMTEFRCSRFTAEFFYYNNALRVIRELSMSQTPAGRTVSKRVLLRMVDTSSVLFNEWFVQKKGKRQHLSALRTEYFTALNVSPYERFFLVETTPSSYVRGEFKDLVFQISSKWSKTSKREPHPFCPYLFVCGIADDEMLALKRELSNEGFRFIDGYDYLGAEFSVASISQPASHSTGVRLKLLNTLADLSATLRGLSKPRLVYQFYYSKSYFEIQSQSIRHVKIQVEHFNDIKGII